MLSRKGLVLAGMAAVIAAMLVFTCWYPLTRRIFVSPPRCEIQPSADDLLKTWEASGARGRVAVCFSRRLNGEVSADVGIHSVKYLEEGLQHSIARKAYHYLPDAAWGEASAVLSSWKAGDSASGFTLLFGGGRVRVLPLSRFESPGEPALVVIVPGDWNDGDLEQIAGFISSGRLVTDYLILLRGTETERARFARIFAGRVAK